MKPLIQIHDAVTGETIVREMTGAEFAEVEKIREGSIATRARLIAEKLEKDTARQALLDRLGISEEEAQLLLG